MSSLRRLPRAKPLRGIWAGLALTPIVVALAALLIAIIGGGSSAKATTPATSAGYVTLRNPHAAMSSKQLAAYWTPARMKAAKSADNAISGEPHMTRAGDTATGAPKGAGGYVPAAAIDPTLDGAVQAPSTKSTTGPLDGAYPGPHSTWAYWPKYFRYPVFTIGKLFFTEPGIGDFVCSASVTSGASRQDILWTAGHCVAAGDGSHFWTNFNFCPAYINGPNPNVGCWGWDQASTSGEWFNNHAWSRDYAVINSSDCGTVRCQQVGSYTGSLGFAWNFGRDQVWQDLGYPSESPWTGGALVETSAEHRYDDNIDGFGPATNSIGSSQTPGFSGGPWVLRWNGGSQGAPWINSDNSYYYTSQYGTEIQGPYFDTQVCNFWKSWTGWPGTC